MSPTVWVFCGSKASFPAGVFNTRDEAEAWIVNAELTGTLTEYPVGLSSYDWAILRGLFTPKKPEHMQAAFIQSFSSAHQDHYHYENGQPSQ